MPTLDEGPFLWVVRSSVRDPVDQRHRYLRRGGGDGGAGALYNPLGGVLVGGRRRVKVEVTVRVRASM